jgi:type IV secretion system protein VirB6
MSCPSVLTGERFLTRAIEHIDCQTREIGSYGYLALSEPGSVASLVVVSLLTLFIALFGIRLLFGPQPGTRDVVMDVLKIGIVLTLAFSWPIFRTVIHDVVLDGPGELAASISPSTLAEANVPFNARLQSVDEAMTRLTAFGTGRNTGQLVDESIGANFQGTAVEDDAGLGYGRTLWLTGVVGVLLPLRLLAGILLALAPLAAVLLLFEATRGIFSGWLRGLVLTLIGTLGVTLTLALELAILEPYLADALRLRQLGYAVPSTPTELLSLTLAFLIAKLLLVALLARIAFQRGWAHSNVTTEHETSEAARGQSAVGTTTSQGISTPRVHVIARALETRMGYEESQTVGGGRVPSTRLASGSPASPRSSAASAGGTGNRLGQGGRRYGTRPSASATRRDAR